MVRGVITFYCSECENRFEGIDAEWHCTVSTAPLKCPRCGSWHTRPCTGSFWSAEYENEKNEWYKHIWDAADRERVKAEEMRGSKEWKEWEEFVEELNSALSRQAQVSEVPETPSSNIFKRFMKKLRGFFAICLLAVAAVSCSKKGDEIQKWEYGRIYVTSIEDMTNKFSPHVFKFPQRELDSLGNLGWELVDVITETETVHPNFGNDKYVTGLQPNTRTWLITYVLKRPKASDE